MQYNIVYKVQHNIVHKVEHNIVGKVYYKIYSHAPRVHCITETFFAHLFNEQQQDLTEVCERENFRNVVARSSTKSSSLTKDEPYLTDFFFSVGKYTG